MLKDKIRTLFNIRIRRELPAMGAKPGLGSRITLGHFRMIVTSRPTDELWYFFSLQGWREVTHPRDRRHYVELPRASFDMLVRCNNSDRESRYRQLMSAASRTRRAVRSPANPARAER